ncbi:hypothetical protein [Undibacterium squillarum]|nr:hypothetical protein [Undibacterium squillarum]
MEKIINLSHWYRQQMSTGVFKFSNQRVQIAIGEIKQLPAEVILSGLHISNSQHQYSFGYCAEVFEFFGHTHEYRELGLFLLLAVLNPIRLDRVVHLSNERSEIKKIRIIDSSYWSEIEDIKPSSEDSIEFQLDSLHKHPWLEPGLLASDFPVFNRCNELDIYRNIKDWQDRDILVLAGRPAANIRLALLLLELSNPQNRCLEVALEVEGGFRGVGPLSAEARFWLPGSFAWD